MNMHININLKKLSIHSCAWFFLNMKSEEFRKRSFWVILGHFDERARFGYRTFLYEFSVKKATFKLPYNTGTVEINYRLVRKRASKITKIVDYVSYHVQTDACQTRLRH